jgi:hypothetical protein
MNDGDTNPNMVGIGHVYKAVKEMRVENKEEHEKITTEIVAQGKSIVCLQAKWGFLKWLVPASITAAVGIVSLAIKFLG